MRVLWVSYESLLGPFWVLWESFRWCIFKIGVTRKSYGCLTRVLWRLFGPRKRVLYLSLQKPVFAHPVLKFLGAVNADFIGTDIWSVFYECYMGVWWVLYRAVLRYMSVIWTAFFWNWCFMSVTWVLDERYMGAFYLRKRVLYLSREIWLSHRVFWKNFFFVYRGAHTESYAARVPRIKIVALVAVWCDWLVGNKSAPHLSTWQLRQQKTTVLTMG